MSCTSKCRMFSTRRPGSRYAAWRYRCGAESREPAVGRAFQASLLTIDWLRQQLQRIDQLPVGENLVVQMRAGGSAGRPDVADDVAALDVLSGLHVVRT